MPSFLILLDFFYIPSHLPLTSQSYSKQKSIVSFERAFSSNSVPLHNSPSNKVQVISGHADAIMTLSDSATD